MDRVNLTAEDELDSINMQQIKLITERLTHDNSDDDDDDLQLRGEKRRRTFSRFTSHSLFDTSR